MNRAESQSLASRSLGEIAAGLPGAATVFRRHKLDFCCGGSAILEQAARKKGIELTVPAEACNSWRALYAGLAKLSEDLTEHIHIENNILFPKFEA